MTLQEKMQTLMRHYSVREIAERLTRISGRHVSRSTINAYIHGYNKQVRVKVVARAIETFLQEVNKIVE